MKAKKEVKFKRAVVWEFVDKYGENFFDMYFVDKSSAELMGKLKHCEGRARPVKLAKCFKQIGVKK